MWFPGIIAAQSAGNWTMKFPSAFPSERSSHGMAYDLSHGQVVLFGGQGHGVLNDTWTWDGSNWTQKSPQNSPPARYNHTMVYDSAHGQTVLFGGESSTGPTTSDTWVWDGTNWTQKFPQNSPSARLDHAMTYDSAHGQVVLFGGFDGKYLNDTWTWDGSIWTQKSTQVSPPARALHAMAFDSAHGQTVLFGGDAGGRYLNDTWIWDGSQWTQMAPQNIPRGRSDHAMAYDSFHGQVLLFGGYSGGEFNPVDGDTWTWDGSNWTAKAPQNAPPAREAHRMAYDSANRQVVLFGGGSFMSIGVVGDTWTWDDRRTPQINFHGIVNNASYTLGSIGSSVAPGSIAAVFGTNLTDGSSCLPPTCNSTFGSNGKLNTSMAGTQVTVGATPVPIFYATPTQLGIQIPFELAETLAPVVVTVAGQSSASSLVAISPVGPGIFTATADGKGAGAITHVDGSVITPQNPAHPEEIVIVYATGLGQVMPAVPTGALPAGTSTTVSSVMLNIGGIGVIPDYAGMSGCCVGLNQINARIPAGVTLGNAVTVVLNISGQSSNTATIAVQ